MIGVEVEDFDMPSSSDRFADQDAGGPVLCNVSAVVRLLIRIDEVESGLAILG